MLISAENMYCGAIKRGDILLCQNNDQEMAVTAIQDDILNQSLPTVIGALITPYKKDDPKFVNEVILKKEETGLDKDGVCFLHKIVTVDRRQIIAKKGELKPACLQKIYHALDITLGRFRE